ncbi:MAG: hypothetical protein DWQ44_08905 [Bacteroidetes bacterium]|nr:MAG: hypothetical protein DWQ33_02865 [Bacteroidota bacterium]REK06408.1 MAG: hypothetical protein DWQ39_02695 [Bacteroidota bacterium]REK33174.1 MAG: hypothetical protein DWQ44_08905 [Bacteroidota bacterium]
MGATRGAAQAFVELALDGMGPFLWVDTVNGNIDRYYERYFLPALKQLPGDWWSWNVQKKLLKIRDTWIDFRSADLPENIEGFGYRKIFLNEAGIILKNNYLYTHAILPMLIDYPDSQLIAAGVPKGKHKRDGGKHKFYELWENCEAGKGGYTGLSFTSYDSLLSKDEIRRMEMEMTRSEAAQEIYAEFVDMEGENPFAHHYEPAVHESEDSVFNPRRPIIISVDFNLNPFGVTFSHIWQDADGHHDHTFDEAEIQNGSIPAMIKLIKLRYGGHLHSAMLTGDNQGNKRELGRMDNASYFRQLRTGLSLRPAQVIVPGNPTHADSRGDVNYLFFHSNKQKFPLTRIEVKINPKNCPVLCRDLKTVNCNAFGEIIKRNRNDLNQRADMLDTYRYKVNTFWKKFIIQDQKQRQHGR